jgi:hypothetical protein
MKFILKCSIAALCGVLLAKLIFGQDVQAPTALEKKDSMTFVWKFHEEHRPWLKVFQFDRKDAGNGYDPSYVYLVSDYKPMVKKVGGKWQITFTSEIAENLP